MSVLRKHLIMALEECYLSTIYKDNKSFANTTNINGKEREFK